VSKAKAIAKRVDAYLYIGSGTFHPIQIALETNKTVFTADPYTGMIGKVGKEEIDERKRRIKGAYISYLHAEKIGILVSTKKGQNRLKDAQKLKNKLTKQKKAAYIFLFNTLDFTQLNNFPDIDCWVNTSCPRMAIEDADKFIKPVINIDDLNSKTLK
jgi:2-(3-amino-3-carboxypropyl)histidine synthase